MIIYAYGNHFRLGFIVTGVSVELWLGWLGWMILFKRVKPEDEQGESHE